MQVLLQPFPTRQRGTTIVEFALVAMIFFLLLLGIFEFGRLMFTWNTAVEATRRGARLAVVCDMNDAQIMKEMEQMLPVLQDSDIQITYSLLSSNPPGLICNDVNTCEAVTVEILPGNQTADAFQYFIPFLNSNWKIPAFSTTLTRESLQNGSGQDANPDCT
jgi:Flp pilus assembly protein TadG